MPISNDLFLAILAMDSYNRGYNAGINISGNTLGTATIDPTGSFEIPPPADGTAAPKRKSQPIDQFQRLGLAISFCYIALKEVASVFIVQARQFRIPFHDFINTRLFGTTCVSLASDWRRRALAHLLVGIFTRRALLHNANA